MRGRKNIAAFACCLAILLIVAGCKEDVAAPSGLDEPFSIFGILNPRLNTQSIVVTAVGPLLTDGTDSIDAVTKSTDLNTGETIVWRDSIVASTDASLLHVFLAEFRPTFGSDYRIEVVRSDGAVSAATTHVPAEVAVVTEDRASQILDVFVLGEAFHLLSADVVYTVRWGPDDVCDFPAGSYGVSYKDEYKDELIEVDGGYRIRVNLSLDHERVLAGYQSDHGPLRWQPGVNGLALTGMGVRLVVANSAWDPPGGVFDANVLVQPGVMTNVTNGFGFVGAGYNEERSLYPSEEVVDDATLFFDFMLRPPTDCADYCSCGQQ